MNTSDSAFLIRFAAVFFTLLSMMMLASAIMIHSAVRDSESRRFLILTFAIFIVVLSCQILLDYCGFYQ